MPKNPVESTLIALVKVRKALGIPCITTFMKPQDREEMENYFKEKYPKLMGVYKGGKLKP